MTSLTKYAARLRKARSKQSRVTHAEAKAQAERSMYRKRLAKVPNELHQRAIEYINNTGSMLVAISGFDEDHEPIGPALRMEMAALGYIVNYEEHNIIELNEQFIDWSTRVKCEFL